ncbi:hypothetical protein predicted by Glimmer/Critica [Sorangium cellulosum So ce56]|uniref:Alginate regulatory protein AlgP n=1 Tax=Sorangium cellulosum (strain So ce56) TaxID=448385 RepID=A9G0E3_SORC5|nr:hypothetical protein [Sorangium cellulosum]CAN98850.1 hypothetical protein predicted by Glimmer/Critica [Sorangium cellulosum So ce56]
MNVTDKLDLDGMLNDWPAPAPSTNDEEAWEARAAHIVEAAISRRSEDTAAAADLLAPPDLTAAPGEEQTEDPSREARASGERSTMGDGSQAARASKPEGLSGGTLSRPPEKRRQSLKEIAERVSQAPGRASGMPAMSGAALSTPLPASGRSSAPPGRVSPLPGRGSLSGGARASSPSLRPAEGVPEDSGVIDLNRLNASAPSEVEASETARHGAADQSGDAKAAAVMPVAARRAPSAPVASAPAKKRSGGMIAGAAVAALGLAAAVTVMVKTTAPPQQEIAATAAPAPTTVAAPAAPRGDTRVEPAAPVAAAPEERAVVEQPVQAEEKLVAAPKAQAAPAGTPAPAAVEVPATPVVSPKPEQGKTAAAPAAAGKPGDLPSAMQAAVGDNAERQPSVVSEAPVPASGPLRQQNIPEQPSQGSVQAALGSVMGSAKACVAGANDVSRAQITFSSTGQVSKVSVSGWAASNGQSSCVQSALKGANVGPFSKPSFSVSATIRP